MRVKGRGKIGGWLRFPFIIPATCGKSTGRSLVTDPQIIAVAMQLQCSKLDQSFLLSDKYGFVQDLVTSPRCAGFVGDKNNCIACPCLPSAIKLNGLIAPGACAFAFVNLDRIIIRKENTSSVTPHTAFPSHIFRIY